MNFLSAETNGTTKVDQRYSEYYDKIKSFSDLDTASIFLLSLVVGYKSGKMSDDVSIGDKSKEFRMAYFDDTGRSILYTIADNITDGKMFNEWNSNNDLKKEVTNKFQRYSNVGMDILIEKVFASNMVEGKFKESYDNYSWDLAKFFYDELSKPVAF